MSGGFLRPSTALPVLLSMSMGTIAFAGSAVAQSAPQANVVAGHRLAEQYCTQCHVIVRNGPAGWTTAPSFAAVADRRSATMDTLLAVIEKPHMHMLHLPRDRVQADDIAAYILSLKRH